MDGTKLDTDYLIIGGGIVGAGIFRDLSLHKQKCLLVDRGDFSAATSAASSKMLHGGIRYLENFDFQLVSEALVEKNIWLKLAGHITIERAFYLPNYKDSKFPLPMLKLGMMTYDFLSNYQNSPHKILDVDRTKILLPGLKEEGLRGCVVYFDGIVDDSKLALECIYDGLVEKDSEALNYHEVVEIERFKNYSKVHLLDKLTNEHKIIDCKEIIFATGPFTDQLMNKLNIPWEDKLIPSLGSHLWLRKGSIPVFNPIVFQTHPDNRVIFVIPQREAILIGTTEIPIKGDSDLENLEISKDEQIYLLNASNHYFPTANVTDENILSTFTGIRPLIREPGHDRSKTSRKHGMYHPYPNVHAILGGKYTTFRVMAQEMVSYLLRKENKTYNPNRTLSPFRQKSIINNAQNIILTDAILEKIVKEEKVKKFEDLLVRRLSMPARSHWRSEQDFDEVFENYKNL